MKLSDPGPIFVGRFLIIALISWLIISLFIFSISLWFSLGRLHDSRNLTIYSKFFNFLTYNCSYYSSRIDGDSDCALLSGCAAVCAPKLSGTLGCARLPECVCLPAVLCSWMELEAVLCSQKGSLSGPHCQVGPQAIFCNWAELLAGLSAWPRLCSAIRHGYRSHSTDGQGYRLGSADRGYHMLVSKAAHSHCSGSLIRCGQKLCSIVGWGC